jgi:hypothetical protein
LHYEGIKPLIESGKLVAGGKSPSLTMTALRIGICTEADYYRRNEGAIFESHPDGKSDAPFKGSVVVYTGESPEAVRSIIENDVYATSGVWDLEKAQIIPVSLTFSDYYFFFFNKH